MYRDANEEVNLYLDPIFLVAKDINFFEHLRSTNKTY